jgi:hypothetical protein
VENPNQLITPEDAGSAARDIVGKLVMRWHEGSLPSFALAEALLEAGLEQISQERGPAAAVSVLQELIRRTQDRILAEMIKQAESRSSEEGSSSN